MSASLQGPTLQGLEGRQGLAFQHFQKGTGLLHVLDVEGAPVMRLWNIVRLQSRLLSPAAEAFRYFMLEQGEAYLRDHDAALLQSKERVA